MKDRMRGAVSLCCVIYTVLITAMAIIGMLVEESNQLLGITPKKALMLLAFSAVVGAASLLISGKRCGAVRYAFHFVICFAAFIVFVMIGNKLSVKNAFFLVLLFGFVLVYIVCMAVRRVAARSAKKQKKNDGGDTDSEEYTSIFKKN